MTKWFLYEKGGLHRHDTAVYRQAKTSGLGVKVDFLIEQGETVLNFHHCTYLLEKVDHITYDNRNMEEPQDW